MIHGQFSGTLKDALNWAHGGFHHLPLWGSQFSS